MSFEDVKKSAETVSQKIAEIAEKSFQKNREICVENVKRMDYRKIRKLNQTPLCIKPREIKQCQARIGRKVFCLPDGEPCWKEQP